MTPIAHAKWFVDRNGTYPGDHGFLAEPLTLGLVATAVAMAALWVLATRRWPVAPVPLAGLADRTPRLLATTLGISLAALAADGKLLSPGLAIGGSELGAVLATIQLLVAAWLIVGPRLRGSAFALAGLVAAVAAVAGPLPVLESGVVVGVALYLVLALPGGVRERLHATSALRLALGGSLIVVAFTEKLTAPALTEAVLNDHPSLNLIAAAGLPLGDTSFVAVTGATEVFLGLVIMSGAGSQLIALAALVPFAATVAVFGVPELVGHLPIYGALGALAIGGSRTAAGVRLSAAEPTTAGRQAATPADLR